MFGNIRKIHLIGIGGSGMCGIAEVLVNRGFEVTGSDQAENVAVRRLRGLGAEISIGHAADNVGRAQVVVVSSAIQESNVEIQAARARHLPVIPRAEMLMELMRQKTGVAIAGAHGKTTTTTLVLSVLSAGGLDPTAVIGGRVNGLGSNAQLGKGEYFIVEADESDGSFLRLTPTLAVITNIDREHMNHYGSMDKLRGAFRDFANAVPFYGASVLCIDDAEVEALLPQIRRRVITYGLSARAEIRGEVLGTSQGKSRVVVYKEGTRLGEIQVPLPGIHNVRNALAAVALGLELNLPIESLNRGFSQFTGIERRFQKKGEQQGILIIDDYGHHPREIEATLTACREAYPGRRLTVLFQPHRYTRLADLLGEFAESLRLADQVVLLPVYAAGEAPIPGADSAALAEEVRKRTGCVVEVLQDRAQAPERLRARLESGDVLMTLGAGDVYRVGEQVLDELQTRGVSKTQ